MLIFTRKPGERFIINDDIVVTVLDYKGKQVRIGVDAPQNVKIYREEIYQKINLEELDLNNKG